MSDSLIWTLLGHLVCIAQWAAFILVDYAYLGRGRRFRHPCVWAALLALAVLALSVLCGFGFFNIMRVNLIKHFVCVFHPFCIWIMDQISCSVKYFFLKFIAHQLFRKISQFE